jgi:alpha-amylase/alpha-mannosidase (GH57 family)
LEKYICVHGHFYQPPRENPWLESIELQDSAYPYHDWNERITAECYGPNGTSRILDGAGKIIRIVNNYAHISYNFGPTLLSWMEEKAPDSYRAIFEADRMSMELFSGHGSALAQVYNHMIMPLANQRDRFSQVYWGIRDFEFRFARKPEGMWLAETAVDIPTLEILAELGMKFTILAPHQARRFRKIGSRAWTDLAHGGIDPTRAYQINLPSGRSMSLFFYDGPISRAIAFERLLEKGENLVNRLMGAFSEERTWPQLVHIATDGETYGHHHRYGDMALAYAISQIESGDQAKLTNYGEFLEKFPPTHEVEIVENSSWSCAHGIERWRTNCGCNSGSRPQWNQEWRAPLRESLDWLRDAVAPLYEKAASELLKDPWMARNNYIDVLLDRSEETVVEFLNVHATRELKEEERIRALKLLESQRQLMLMYTSCGWFFDELSGIETVQVIQYAGRAIQLAEQAFGQPFEAEFVDRLSRAKSNISELADGRRIYERYVKPAAMDLYKVAAHYAISSVFENGGVSDTKTYCYDLEYEDYKGFVAGKARLVLGWVRVTSEVTLESARLMFAILHLGDHNLNGGVREYRGSEAYGKMLDEMVAAFKKADFTETIRAMDRHFGTSTYTLKSLFKDEQRKILSSILDSTLQDAEGVLRGIYEDNAPLMRFLADMMVPLPKALQAAAEFSINMSVRHAFQAEDLDRERIITLVTEGREMHIPLDIAGLGFAMQKYLMRLMEQLWADPDDIELLTSLEEAVELARQLPFEVNLWSVQNNYYELAQRVFPELKLKADGGDEAAAAWVKPFLSLGEKLYVKVS